MRTKGVHQARAAAAKVKQLSFVAPRGSLGWLSALLPEESKPRRYDLVNEFDGFGVVAIVPAEGIADLISALKHEGAEQITVVSIEMYVP
ncbi:MAG: hypothetical protein WC675_00425 [Patescibacteria group bacterium]